MLVMLLITMLIMLIMLIILRMLILLINNAERYICLWKDHTIGEILLKSTLTFWLGENPL